MSILARRIDPPAEPLADGASVGVIGAGPAGAFFALHLTDLLSGTGRKARVTLIDRKVFSSYGPSGCNMCAGAIGPSIVGKIRKLPIPFDKNVISRIADGYEIHGRGVSVTVRGTDKDEIYTVFRGGGPARQRIGTKSFDQYLLDAAIGLGAEFLHLRVEEIVRTKGGYRILFSDGSKRDFDFIVGAFGVNSSISGKLGIGYRPPETWHTVQAEIPAGNEFIEGALRNRIHIVPALGRNIRFLAITPKEEILTLTGIGEHVKISDLENERARNNALAALLPKNARILCHCHPQIPVGFARHPYSDRMAVVGDAFISRYLKNGIESSHDTSRILAEAIVRHGVSGNAMKEHFYRPCMRQFRYDNVWGKVLFGIYETVLRKGHLSDNYLKSVKSEASGGDMTQERILWSVFTGDSPYREIAREAFTPRALWNLSRSLLEGR